MEAQNIISISEAQSLFHANPSQQTAERVSLQFKSQLNSRLLEYFKLIEAKLSISLSSIKHDLNKIDLKKKLSPEYYNLFFKLRDALKNGEELKVLDTLQNLSRLLAAPYAHDSLVISSILNDAWETDFVAKIRDLKYKNNGTETGTMFPLPAYDFSKISAAIHSALSQLSRLSPTLSSEFNLHVSRVAFFNGTIKGLSSPDTFGVLYLKIPEESDDIVLNMLEHLVHEAAHLHLHALMMLDPIILNDPNELYTAPIRKDARPMKGILHAYFVLSRMKYVFDRFEDKNKQHPLLDSYKDRINLWYSSAAFVVKEKAKFTANGQQLFQSLLEFNSL